MINLEYQKVRIAATTGLEARKTFKTIKKDHFCTLNHNQIRRALFITTIINITETIRHNKTKKTLNTV